MILSKKNLKLNKNLPFYFKNINFENTCIFDIETTGFNRKNSKIILIGFLEFINNDQIITQAFIDNLSDEHTLLEYTINKLKNKEILISYNGYAFDIPFINERFKQNNMNYEINKYKSLDLLKIVRKNKQTLNLDNYKLKTVEKFLGINRKDTIDGKESIKLYYEYLKTKDKKLEEKILLHNYEDIKFLLPMLDILNFCSKDSIYSEALFNINFGKNNISKKFIPFQNSKLYLKNLKINSSSITIQFYVENIKENIDLIYENFANKIEFINSKKELLLTLPLIQVNKNNNIYSILNIDELFNFPKFNSLSTNEKEILIFKYNKDILYYNIYSYLNSNFNKIIEAILN